MIFPFLIPHLKGWHDQFCTFSTARHSFPRTEIGTSESEFHSLCICEMPKDFCHVMIDILLHHPGLSREFVGVAAARLQGLPKHSPDSGILDVECGHMS